MILILFYILVFILFLRVLVVRRRLMDKIKEWRGRFRSVGYKGIEMPFRVDEASLVEGSANKVKRKMAMKLKSNLRKGRVEYGVNEHGDKILKKTKKYK